MIHTFKKLEKIRETYRGQNFLHFDENIIAQFPKIESSPFVMPTSLVANFSWIQTKVELIGEEASLVCQAGFQMVISNSSGNRVMEVVDRIRVVCNQEGMWEKPFHYYCHNATWTTTRVYTKKPFKNQISHFFFCRCCSHPPRTPLSHSRLLLTLYFPSFSSFSSFCCSPLFYAGNAWKFGKNGQSWPEWPCPAFIRRLT